MHRIPILVAGWVLCVAALTGARQDQGQSPPTFRSGVELIQLDVSVLDDSRRPVRGLAATDFTVRVDGQPREVVAFRAVDLPPPPPPPSASWLRDVAPDVVANTRPSRVVAILIDDGSFNVEAGAAELSEVRKARSTARAVVDALGPDDMAAVLFTDNSHRAQGFTRDRARLLAAVDGAALFPSPPTDLGESPNCQCGLCSIAAIGQIASMLQSLPGERKTIVYLSVGVPVVATIAVPYNPIGAGEIYRKAHCNARQQNAMDDAIRQAGLANVTVQAVDVRGLKVGGLDPRIGYLQAMSEDTGGRAVVRNNDMEMEVPALLAESGSYYLLGIEAPRGRDDGRLRRIDVSVDRDDVEVRTRRGYYAPTAAERRRQERDAADLQAGRNRALDAAAHTVLPKADVPLDVNVFAIADPRARERAALGIVLGVVPDASKPAPGRNETVRVVATAFDPESGRSVASHTQTLNVRRNPAGDGARLEVLSKLPIKPGRYEVRIAVETGDGRTGSVYTYADVPDFRREELTTSGLVLGVEPAALTGAPATFRDLMPIRPSANRTFSGAEHATAWVRIHRRSGAAASLALRITDEHNAVVFEREETFVAAQKQAADAVDGQLDLPIDSLPAGEYLLTAEVVSGNHTVRRDARFRIEK